MYAKWIDSDFPISFFSTIVFRLAGAVQKTIFELDFDPKKKSVSVSPSQTHRQSGGNLKNKWYFQFNTVTIEIKSNKALLNCSMCRDNFIPARTGDFFFAIVLPPFTHTFSLREHFFFLKYIRTYIRLCVA